MDPPQILANISDPLTQLLMVNIITLPSSLRLVLAPSPSIGPKLILDISNYSEKWKKS